MPVARTTATLNMSFNFATLGSGRVRFSYRRGTTGGYTNTTWSNQSGASTYSLGITGLTANSLYQFYATLNSGATTLNGSTLSFTTTP